MNYIDDHTDDRPYLGEIWHRKNDPSSRVEIFEMQLSGYLIEGNYFKGSLWKTNAAFHQRFVRDTDQSPLLERKRKTV